MKELSVLFFLKTWGVAIVIWVSGQVLFFKMPSVFTRIVEQQTVIYSIIAAITVVFWHGINRLGSIDDLDDLKNSHRDVIRSKVKAIKLLLHNRVKSLILATVLLFLLSSVGEDLLAVKLVLEQELILVFATLWLYGSTYPAVFDAIEHLRQSISDMKRKEKRRQQLIAEMQKERQENPLNSDEHLEKYKKLFDSASTKNSIE